MVLKLLEVYPVIFQKSRKIWAKLLSDIKRLPKMADNL
jgi:hypothetical protein